MEFKTPTLDKIAEVRDQCQIIGEFLEWLHDKGISLCELNKTKGWSSETYERIDKSTDSLLYEYFEIDENAAEQERIDLLNKIREMNIPVTVVEHKQ